MEREKGTPHHSNYLSWPELQVTFPSSTEVAVGSTLVGRFFWLPSLFNKHIFFFRDPVLQNFLLQKDLWVVLKPWQACSLGLGQRADFMWKKSLKKKKKNLWLTHRPAHPLDINRGCSAPQALPWPEGSNIVNSVAVCLYVCVLESQENPGCNKGYAGCNSLCKFKVT